MPNIETEILGIRPIVPNLPALQNSLPELVDESTEKNHLSVVFGKLGMNRAAEGQL